MNITILHGQSHQGSTCRVARQLAERLGGTVTEFFLPRDFGQFCTGCTACFMAAEEKCPHYERLAPITRAIDGADVLTFASPVYVYHATGAMKALLGHYGYRWMVHRPSQGMFRKQAVCVSTAAGAGTRSANRDMADSAFFWGVGKIYRLGIGVAATSWDGVSEKKKAKIQKKIDALARRIRGRAGEVKPGLKTKAFFAVMRMIHKRGWNETDDRYWQEMGWLGKARPWK